MTQPKKMAAFCCGHQSKRMNSYREEGGGGGERVPENECLLVSTVMQAFVFWQRSEYYINDSLLTENST